MYTVYILVKNFSFATLFQFPFRTEQTTSKSKISDEGIWG